MTSQEDIIEQQELLNTYRRTLAHYLKQQALLGTAYTPPAVTHGILDARENILRIKNILHGWGVEVKEHPDDEDTVVTSLIVQHSPISYTATLLSDNVDRSPPEPIFLRMLIMAALCSLGLFIGWKLLHYNGPDRFVPLLGLGLLCFSGIGIFGLCISSPFIVSSRSESNILMELAKRIIMPLILLGLLLGVVWFFAYESNLSSIYLNYDQMIAHAYDAAWQVFWNWFRWLSVGTLALIIFNLVLLLIRR